MTQHGPIYTYVEKELKFIESEKKRIAKEFGGVSLPNVWKSDILEKILPKIQELETTWISVEERLPKTQEWLLLATEDGACHVAYYDIRKKEWISNSKFGANPEKWMPLPQ